MRKTNLLCQIMILCSAFLFIQSRALANDKVDLAPLSKSNSSLTQVDINHFKPGPEIKELSFLEGNWDVEIICYPSEILPKGNHAKGKAEYHWIFNGMVLEGHRKINTSKRYDEAKEYIVFDRGNNLYQIVTVNFPGIICNKIMQKFADAFVTEYRGIFKEKSFITRGIYKVISENEMEFTSQISIEGDIFKPFQEIKMKRCKNEGVNL